MARYLSDHPDILFSKIKEPHYFAFDFSCPVVRRISEEDDYLDLFADDRQGYKAIGEASTGYIYSKVAVDNILKFAENPKFIVVLRNPVDMVLSGHAQMLKSGHEDFEDFFKAWRLSDARINGYSLPSKKTENILVSYKEFGRVGSYLESVIKKVGRENLHLIIFDDILSDIRSVYKGILDFLGVPDDGRIEFPVYNERRYHRFKSVAKFINDPPKHLLALNDLVKGVLGIQRIGFIDWLRNKNLQKNI